MVASPAPVEEVAAVIRSGPAAAHNGRRSVARALAARAGALTLPASVVVAVLPLVVAAVRIVGRAPAIAWTGDRALTELAVREASRANQLLGIGGRFGWRHPGPIWMYLLAPLYALTGRAPWSLAVGAVALHIIFIAVAVIAVGRCAGARAAAVLALLVAAYLEATGLRYWTNLWAGYAFTWPVLALVTLCALAMSVRSAGWAFPAAVLVGTFCVQTDVSTIVVVGAIGLVALVVRLRRFGVADSICGPRSPVSPAAVVIASVVVLSWIPPLVEQAVAPTGNLTLLARFGAQGSGGHPLRAAAGATGAALSVVPLGARWVLRNGAQDRIGEGPWWAVAFTVAYLVALAVSAGVAWRRGRLAAGDLAALSAVGVAAAVASMSRVDGPINFYLLTWITVLPVAALAAVVVTTLPSALTRAALPVAAVFAVVVTVSQGGIHDYDRSASDAARTQAARALDVLGPTARRTVRIHVVTADAWQLAAGVGLQLERGGAHIEVDPEWVFLFGDAFKPVPPGRPAAELWFARPHELPLVTIGDGVVDLGEVAGINALARQDPRS